MKRISTIYFHFFRNDEHYEFMTAVRDLILKFPAVRALVAPFYDSFTGLIDREEQLINVMHKSDYTRTIAEANGRVDHTLAGMREAITVAQHHFDPATAEAARSLRNRFKAFGNIVRKAYEEKIPDVNLLIGDFRSDEYAAKVALAGLSPWIDELQAAETSFEELIALRNAETSKKPQGRLKEIRRKTDALYRRITVHISAAATLEDAAATPEARASDTYGKFIAELNVRIAYFNNHARRHARKDIGIAGHCAVEPIPAQAYTGKAVTPLPAACYLEEGKPAAELVFSRDFTVTYRNNINPGTADLILHGKGACKGHKKITFTIRGAI
ncbi:MAG: DUF6261 family protein [Tannerella sp.]|jgi:hypothetical protein|nr:DUF6261 family protein [Tannerella sp.]